MNMFSGQRRGEVHISLALLLFPLFHQLRVAVSSPSLPWPSHRKPGCIFDATTGTFRSAPVRSGSCQTVLLFHPNAEGDNDTSLGTVRPLKDTDTATTWNCRLGLDACPVTSTTVVFRPIFIT